MNTTDEPESNLGDEALWSVSDVVPDFSSLTTDQRAQIDSWSQGDVIQRLPLLWLGVQDDAVTSVVVPRSAGDTGYTGYTNLDATAVFSRAATPGWVIVSQTCDIGTKPPGSLHPFVQVAPLVNASRLSAGLAKMARSGQCNYLVATDYDLRESRARWFVDLRLQAPVSKAVLIGREPVHAFAEGPGALVFAERVAGKFRRGALHSVLSEDLAEVVEKFVKGRGTKTNAIAHTEHVRVLVDEGSRLDPQRVSLLVVTRTNLSPEDQAIWRDGLEQRVKELLTKSGIAYTATLIQTPDEMSARLYRVSTPLRVDALGSATWW